MSKLVSRWFANVLNDMSFWSKMSIFSSRDDPADLSYSPDSSLQIRDHLNRIKAPDIETCPKPFPFLRLEFGFALGILHLCYGFEGLCWAILGVWRVSLLKPSRSGDFSRCALQKSVLNHLKYQDFYSLLAIASYPVPKGEKTMSCVPNSQPCEAESHHDDSYSVFVRFIDKKALLASARNHCP